MKEEAEGEEEEGGGKAKRIGQVKGMGWGKKEEK
jgi:hypothetical protein